MDAYNKMEKLEHTARVVLAARLQDRCRPCPRRRWRSCGAWGKSIRAGGELWDRMGSDFGHRRVV